jgi:hypothetical protein
MAGIMKLAMRMSTKGRVALAIAVAALGCVVAGRARADGLEVDFEAGVAAASANVVRIPGEGGTRFSLVDDLEAAAEPVFRLRVGYRIAQRHLITALYAPLQLEASGEPDRDVVFQGETFAAGEPVLATYRFDSYRLSYRFSFVRDEEWDLAAGVTGKIRDAEISLYGAQTASKTNTGFVPLINAHAEYRPGGGAFGIVLDVDALAAPQGRAEDVMLALAWDVDEKITLRAGYRMLEGGADNDEVYNFAWIHYGVAGVTLRL